MKTRILLVSVCVSLFYVTPATAAPLADRLPSNTLLYLGWGGRSLVFDGSILGQLLKEPGLGQLFTTVRQGIQTNIPPGPPQEIFNSAWELGRIVWQHPIAIALVDLRAPQEGQPPVCAALLADLGEDRDPFEKHLNAILEALGEDISLVEKTEGGVAYKTLQLPPDMTLCFGFKENLFFAGLGEDLCKELILLNPAKSLAANKKFTDALRDVAGDNEQISMYLDVTALKQRIEQMIGGVASPAPATAPTGSEDFRRIFDALGLGKVTTIAGSVRIVDYGMYTKIRVLSPAPHSGLLTPLTGAPLTEQDLAGAPDDADLLAAAKLNPEALYAELRKVLREIDPRAEADFLREVGALEEDLGVSIPTDVLGNLGDTWVLCSAPSQGGFLTGTVLTVSVKDTEKLAETIAKIEAFFKRQLEPTTSPTASEPEGGFELPAPPAPHREGSYSRVQVLRLDDTEIHYLVLPPTIPIAPAWMLYKDKLYVALWPQVIESTIDNVGKRSKPLTQDPQFRKFRARITGKPSMLFYANAPKILRQIYPVQLVLGRIVMAQLARQVGLESLPLWPMALSRLEKYTLPEIAAVSADEQGITFEGYGSQPSVGMAVPVGAAVALPAVSRLRTQAQRVKSMSNLQKIGMAIAMYAEDPARAGQFPPDLGTLIQQDLVSTRCLVSPLSNRRPPKLLGSGKLDGEIDYVYIRPPGGVEEAHRFIMAYERPENYSGRETNVLFADYHVERLDIGSFRGALEYTRGYLRRHPAKKPAGAEQF